MSVKLNCFVLADSSKCIGCKVCEVACSTVHSAQEVATAGMMETPIIPRLYLVHTLEVKMPVQCRHCEDAPCANVCPVNAIKQQNGMILIDEKECIGCKTCMMACPFGAIELVPQYVNDNELKQRGLKIKGAKGLEEKSNMIASKCDLCNKRAEGPACVEACPKQALSLVDPKKAKKARNQEAAVTLLQSAKKFML